MRQSLDYDEIASEYARHRKVHPGVLQGLVATSGIGRGSHVLEVGCGTGNYIFAVERLTGAICWGADPSEGMLAEARARSCGVEFQLGRAERLDFPPASFDLVFSVDVIHHVVDRLGYFREVHRILKPGGKLCTVTDSQCIIRHRQPLAVYFQETVEVDLGRYPRIAQLRAWMEQVGFAGVNEEMVELSYQLTDIQPYRDKAFSALHLIPEEAFQRGVGHMEQDLQLDSIPCVSRYALVWGTR